MNLASALPTLLPQAVAWAEGEALGALRDGDPLGPAELAIARRAGVRSPKRIRVRVVDSLPMPENPVLREAAVRSGLLGSGMIGLTLGYAIFMREGHVDIRLISHESRHVYQYEAHGGIAAFLPAYLAQVVSVGYASAPFELDAQEHEVKFLPSAHSGPAAARQDLKARALHSRLPQER